MGRRPSRRGRRSRCDRPARRAGLGGGKAALPPLRGWCVNREGEAEVDRLLAAEPGNLAALLRKGDLRTEAGDDRAAVAFYKRALNLAAGMGALPMSLKPAIERAQAGLARAEGHFARHLEAALTEAGFPAGHRPPRFQDSLDLMTG